MTNIFLRSFATCVALGPGYADSNAPIISKIRWCSLISFEANTLCGVTSRNLGKGHGTRGASGKGQGATGKRQGARDKGQGARDKGQHYRQHLLISFICLYDGAIIDGALGDLLKGFIVKHLCLVTPCSARNALIKNTYSLSANCSPRGGQGAKPPTPSIPPRGGSADSPVRMVGGRVNLSPDAEGMFG